MINLTNPDRKTDPQPKPKQFVTSKDEAGKTIVKTKYSAVFQDAGQNYVRAYEVIRLCYWLKYELITHFDCALYDTLHLFAEKQIEFTTEYLAKALHCSSGTLRESLDNLENAELIEVVKVRDELGERNDYIIHSPFYEKANFNDNKRLRIRTANEDQPTVFLESQVERLSRQIKKNSVERLRRIVKDKSLTGIRAAIAKRAANSLNDRRFLWKRLVKTFGVNAVRFDAIVYDIIHDVNLRQMHGKDYQAAFVRYLKKACEHAKIIWTHWIEGIADELRAYYESRIKQPANTGANAAPASGVSADGSDRAETQEFLLKVLQKRQQEPKAYQFSDLIRVFREALKDLNFSEVSELAEPYFTPELWQKLTVELRT